MSKKLTTSEFIAKAVEVHGDKYDYSKVSYTKATGKVTIICPIHGEFTQAARDHTNGKKGCVKCAHDMTSDKFRSSTEEFASKALSVHLGKYSYEKVNYVNAKKKVTITCPHHGDFKQTPNDHLNGCGCRHCRTENIGWTDSKWKEQASNSKHFSGFKVYIVKIFDGEESFIKIGKTFVGIPSRFGEISLYYNYKVLEVIEADADSICKMERKYQRENKEYKYSPSITFNGHTECFSKVVINDKVYE